MAASINGIGTTFYGRADARDDGSYVVTKWVIFVFAPIIPLGSMRVWPVAPEKTPWWRASTGTRFKAIPTDLHMPHVLKGYGATLGIVLLLTILDKIK
jgi:hypothetical protein